MREANKSESPSAGDGENRKILSDYMSEVDEKLTMKSDLLRENNAAVNNWPDERFFSKKDSTLKKNTAFVKKIRNLTESSKESLLKDFEGLNLSKYVAEVATAVTEPKVKMTDIPFMLRLCSLMHRRYSDFSSLLLDAWKKVFSQQKTEKAPNLSKLRVDLVFFADSITVGVLPENDSVRLLALQLTQLTNGDKNFVNISIVSSFVKACGDDWAGLIPRKYTSLAKTYGVTIRRSAFLPKERKTKCRSLFHDYYTAAFERLTGMAKEARRVIASNRHQMFTKGEIHPERHEKEEQLVAACKKFHEAVSILADVVDKEAPPAVDALLAVEEDENNGLKTEGQLQSSEGGDTDNSALFEDEDTRLFYESLQDIRAMIPAILYKESEQSASRNVQPKKDDPASTDESSNDEIDVEKVESELAQAEEEAEEDIACPKTLEAGQEGGGLVSTSANGNASSSTSAGQKSVDKFSPEPREEEGPPSAKMMMDTFLTQLPKCVNRDLIDRAAYDFCVNLNKKPNRRRLANALASVPRTRYDLLPFYARFVATLNPVMPDLSQELNNALLQEFRWHLHKKDQVNLESKLKTVRFIGELVKFRVFPADEALNCVKRLLPNFVHHQIDMTCGLLDTCGRFLYRLPATHRRTQIYLEVMLRKKNALHMDARYSLMIENTFFFCDPPKNTTNFGQMELTPLQRFLRQLLWRDLNRNSINSVLKIVRKIDWNDASLVSFMEGLFTSSWQVRFQYIGCLASVLSGLSLYHKDFAVAVVDNVIEDVRVGMEKNDQTMSQRRLSMVKYLGLLYNYKLVESPVIFTTLYSLITLGVSLDYLNPSLIDPPTSLARIPLVCTLLETCGSYFDRGSRRKKLNIFVVYFQRYYWSKRMHPIYTPPKWTATDSSIEKQEKQEEGEPDSPTSAATTAGDQLPPELEHFEQIPFPDAVEQQFEETLCHLQMKPSTIRSLEEAEALVQSVERRYTQRMVQLMQSYGLNTPRGSSRTGVMETISEEDDLKLDEDDSDDEEEFFKGEKEVGATEEGYTDSRQRNGKMDEGGSESTDGGEDDEDTATLAPDEDSEEIGADEENEDNEDGEDDAEEEEGEEDEMVRLGLRPKYIKCPEDDEFVAELERMTAEAIMPGAGVPAGPAATVTSNAISGTASLLPSLESLGVGAAAARKAAARSAAAQTQSAAENIIAALESTTPRIATPPLNGDHTGSMATTSKDQTASPSVVQFSLVVRRPGGGSGSNGSGGGGASRPRLVPLAVPQSVPFAARLLRIEAEEREEKARLKERVLEMHKAQKEADETNCLNSDLLTQIPSNVNRDRWLKYNHPKRAPDAEAVFGASSVSLPPPPSYVNYRAFRR